MTEFSFFGEVFLLNSCCCVCCIEEIVAVLTCRKLFYSINKVHSFTITEVPTGGASQAHIVLQNFIH